MARTKKAGSKRTLVRWSDDLDKQLLLCIQYACNEAGLRIPWDNVAKLMGIKFSDGAIVQHLAKLRHKMAELDLPIPPPLRRSNTMAPSKIYANPGSAPHKSQAKTGGADEENDIATPAPKPKPKPPGSGGKKRRRRSTSDSDSDSQFDDEDMDIADTSEDEGSSKNKKKQARRVKSKETMEHLKDVGDVDKAQDQMIAAHMGASTPVVRSRGITQDYARLNEASDDEMPGVLGKSIDLGGPDNQKLGTKSPVEKALRSDEQISPRSRNPATLIGTVGSMEYQPEVWTPVPKPAQYHAPWAGMSAATPTSYPSHSNMTSFSSRRNNSSSSMASSLPRPTFSSQSSIHPSMLDQGPYTSLDDYFNRGSINLDHTLGVAEADMNHFGNSFDPRPFQVSSEGNQDAGDFFDFQGL